MKYLIIVCEEIDYDQWEDTPYKVTDDWQRDYPKGKQFDVYEINENGSLTKIKNNYDYMEKGMVFGYWTWDDEEDTFHVIVKYPNKTPESKVPKKVKNFFADKNDVDNSLSNCSYIAWGNYIDRTYIYGEYHDGDWPTC